MTTPSKEPPNLEQAVPDFWVHDINQSVRFYTEGLGFKMTNQWVHEGKLRWCRLDLGNVSVMLQEFWKEGEDYNLPESKVGIGVGILLLLPGCGRSLAGVCLARHYCKAAVRGKRAMGDGA